MRRMPQVIAHAGTYGRVKPYNPQTYVKENGGRKVKKHIPTEAEKRWLQTKEKNSIERDNAKAAKKAAEMRRAKQQNDYYNTSAHRQSASQRSWQSYENAVNKAETGAHATTKAKRQHRANQAVNEMQNKSDFDRTMDSARYHATNAMSKNVPSQNPTAGGGGYVPAGGKEKPGHKYVAKVRTKSGKIRYIYDKNGIETASGKHLDPKAAFDSQKHAKHVSNKADYMNAWKRREASENAQRARNADPVNQIRKFANRTVRSITKAAGGAINNARNFLKQFGIG